MGGLVWQGVEGRRESVLSVAGSGGSAGGPNHVYQHHCSVILIIIIIVTISIIIILHDYHHRHNHDYHKGENRRVGVNLCLVVKLPGCWCENGGWGGKAQTEFHEEKLAPEKTEC